MDIKEINETSSPLPAAIKPASSSASLNVLEQTVTAIVAGIFKFESRNRSIVELSTTNTSSTTIASAIAAIFNENITSVTNDDSNAFPLNVTNQTFRYKEYPALANFEGELDPEYLERINPFWLQFNPTSARTHYIIAVIYILISSIGCFGNALVIYMFIRCKSLRTSANTLVINLAISDLLMLAKCPIAIYNSLKQGPALGYLGCKMYGFFGGLSGTVSIITLTAIAMDRYNVVVYPLDPLRSTTKQRSRLTLAFIWLYSFMFAVIPTLDIGLSIYVPEGLLTTCSFDYLDKTINARIFMFIFFVGAWCVPFVTIFYCYFYILKAVSMANSIQSSKDKNKTEMKLTIIVICVIGLWFLAWTPYSIVALLGITGNEDKLTPLGSMIPAIFCKTSACIDPYIYCATHPRFRMEFRRLFFGQRYIHRTSTLRSSFPTRSSTSTRRLRIVRDVETGRTSNGETTVNGDEISGNVSSQRKFTLNRGYKETRLTERLNEVELSKF